MSITYTTQIHRVTQDTICQLKIGLKFCWSDKGIRFALIYVGLTSVLIHGPITLALPLIVKSQLNLSELSYGTIYGCLGLGILLGTLSSLVFKISGSRIGEIILVGDLFNALIIWNFSRWSDGLYLAGSMLLIGISSGLIIITGIVWFQKRTPIKLMGRVMSLLVFATLGLLPVSTFLSGFIVNTFSVETLLKFSSGPVVCIALVGLAIPQFRKIGRTPKLSSLGYE